MNARVARSSALNLADHCVKFIAVFLLTPVLADSLGDRLYGVWLLVMAFFSYYTFLDAGMNLAGVRYLARENARAGSNSRAGDVIATCTAIFRKIALVSVVLTVIGIAAAALFFDSPAMVAQVRWVIAIYGVGLALRFWMMVYPIILKSSVAYGAIAGTSVVRTVVQTALSLWCLHQGYGIVALAIVMGCCDIAQQLAVTFAALRLLKQKGSPDGSATAELRRELIAYSAKSFATRLAINLKDRIDPFVVAGVAGAMIVPQFAVGSRFLGIARDLVNALFGGQLLASFSATEEGEGRGSLRENFLFTLRLSAAVAALFGVGMAMLGPVFIERWMGERFAPSAEVLLVLVVPYCLFLMQYPALGMLFSVDKHASLGRAAWIGSAINLVLSIALGIQFGLMGVVWATVVDLALVYGLLLPRLASSAVEVSIGRYLRVLASGAGMVLIPAVVYWIALRGFIRPDYLNIFLLAVGLTLVAAGAVWFGGLTRRGRGCSVEEDQR